MTALRAASPGWIRHGTARNAAPCLAVADCLNSRPINAVLASKRQHACSGREAGCNGENTFGRQLGARMPQACSGSPLGGAVTVIIALRAEKKVFDVATRWVVTAVQHIHAYGDRSIGILPCGAVCGHRFAVAPNPDVTAAAVRASSSDNARCHAGDFITSQPHYKAFHPYRGVSF